MADADAVPESYPMDFRALVVRELEAVGLGLKGWRDGGIEFEKEDGSDQFLSLVTLYQRVSGASSEDALTLVRTFCQHATFGNPDELSAMPTTMEDAAERLMVRIGKPTEDGTNAVWPVPGVEELSVQLVIDFPSMLAYVPAAMVEKSETPANEWLYRALDQLASRTPEGWLKLTHEAEGIYCGHADDCYDAARALVICEVTSCDDLGWLVTIPNRDWLFARKVEKEGLPYFHLLKVLARQAMADQPHPLSDEIFWIRPGKIWERFRIDFEDEKVTVYPPPDFAAALELKLEEGETSGEPDAL